MSKKETIKAIQVMKKDMFEEELAAAINEEEAGNVNE